MDFLPTVIRAEYRGEHGIHFAFNDGLENTVVAQWLELEHREDFYAFLHAHRIPMTTLEVLQRDRTASERLGF